MMKIVRAPALVFILIVCGSLPAQGPAEDAKAGSASAERQSAKTAPTRSTRSDRQAVEVTIYNSDLGLIKERRKISVPAGEGELHFVDVPSLINPVTVHVKPLANAGDFSILEQNYEYDLISHAKLMDKYVGKKIKIVEWNEYQDRKSVVEAELLSVNSGEVYRIDGEIYLGHPGTKVLPKLPGNLISRPTLSWQYRNKAAREYQLEVSYLTGGINWSADYILVAADGKAASELTGWVTVNNRSGAEYKDAKLKLVAGNVNRVRDMNERGGPQFLRAAASYDMAAPAAGFTQSEVFEYYMYDLQRPTTVKENQTKQISLLEAPGVTVVKEYVTSSSGVDYRRDETASGAVKQPVLTYLTLKNSKENKLGSPIPAGVVRIYTADAQGRRQFVGEDRVAHTPKDEDIRLKVGEAFDIVAERKQAEYKQVTNRIQEISYEITVRNRKNENVTVTVHETGHHGQWTIAQSSHKHTQINATSFQFSVPVEKGKEVAVKYKIRTGI